MCFQPTEFIWAFLFYKFPFVYPPPPQLPWTSLPGGLVEWLSSPDVDILGLPRELLPIVARGCFEALGLFSREVIDPAMAESFAEAALSDYNTVGGGGGVAEATGLGFVCFFVINPPVFQPTELFFFCLIVFQFTMISTFTPIFFIEISFV